MVFFLYKIMVGKCSLEIVFTSPLEYWMQVERMQVGQGEDFKAWAMSSDPYYR